MAKSGVRAYLGHMLRLVFLSVLLLLLSAGSLSWSASAAESTADSPCEGLRDAQEFFNATAAAEAAFAGLDEEGLRSETVLIEYDVEQDEEIQRIRNSIIVQIPFSVSRS